MQVNDVIELDIESMSFGPMAVARHQVGQDRIVVFVEGAIPGERVAARLTQKHKNYWDSRAEKILKPSPDRVAPACPVFDHCGGCQWQFMTYEAQLKAKEEVLVHQLKRTARLELNDVRGKLTVHPAKNPFGYRARLQVHGDSKGLGFFAAGSRSIVKTERCLVAHPDVQKAWIEFLSKRPLAELAKATGEFKVEWTRVAEGQVLEAINRKHAALGFTQVNPEQNETLKALVGRLARRPLSDNTRRAQAARSKELLLDLYGGDGNLSKDLADEFTRVACVDSHNEGADPTEIKPPLADFTLIKARVEDFLVNQHWRDWGDTEEIGTIIADPPRNGLREAAPRIAALRASRVVLVSCDPSTLARDLNSFTASYVVDEIHLVDMFPQTYHLETVVSLRLRAHLQAE